MADMRVAQSLTQRRLRSAALLAVVLLADLLGTGRAASGASILVARDDRLIIDENGSRAFDPLANDDGDLVPSSVTVTGTPIHGTAIAGAGGDITYTPHAHYNGDDQFAYQVCDTTSACDTAVVRVGVQFGGPYRLLTVRNGTTSCCWPVELQRPDGLGPREQIPLAFGRDAEISPDGAWIAVARGGVLDIQNLADPTVRHVAQFPGTLASPSWAPNGHAVVVAVEDDSTIYTVSMPSLPNQTPSIERMEYEVDDGAGGKVHVPVLGLDPAWGLGGIAIWSWFEYITPTNTVPRYGISRFQPLEKPFHVAPGDLKYPAWTPDGRLTTGCSEGLCLVVNDRTQTIANLPGMAQQIAWSPDGAKVAFQLCNPLSGCSLSGPAMVMNADGSGQHRIDRTGPAVLPSWDTRQAPPVVDPSGLGGRLTYTRVDRSGANLYTVDAVKPDASGLRHVVTGDPADIRNPQHATPSPDGRRLAVMLPDPLSQNYALTVMDADGTNRQRVRGNLRTQPAWSPDGTEIAFTGQVCNPTCTIGLHAVRPDGTGLRTIAPNLDASFPTWSADGRHLAFQVSDGHLARVWTVPSDASEPATPLMGMPDDGALHPALSSNDELAWDRVKIFVARIRWEPTPVAEMIRQATFDTLIETQHSDQFPAWSPDGAAIAYSRLDDIQGTPTRYRIYVVAADGSNDRRVTFDDVADHLHARWAVAPAANPAPTIVGLSPASGPTAGGTAVTIGGTNFGGPGTTVTFGGVDAPVTGGSSTELQVTAPAHAAGSVDVVVRNADGGTATASAAYTYTAANPAPTIVGLSPASGPTAGGTAVTIGGTNFGGPGTTVTFGGVDAPVTGGSSTELQVTAPAHAAGSVDVVVRNADGGTATASAAYTYTAANPAPTIVGLSPASGPTAGGTAVTIGGTNFGGPGTTVTFGGVDAPVTGGSSTELQVTAPAHAAGSVDVVVRNADGETATASAAYTYTAANPAPTIKTIKPTSAPTTGGKRVTITGTGFASGLQVLFGGVAGTSVVLKGSTSLTVMAPAHAAGTVDIVVRNPDGRSATAAGAFRYTARKP